LIDAVDKCKTNADVKQVGIEWVQQSLNLKRQAFVLHYYSMGKSEILTNS
jgi:methylenetetrahydrofolate reductase (NADPH)